MASTSPLSLVLGVENLAPGVFVLHLERNGLSFQTGQYVSIGLPGQRKEREYSLYSGEHDEVLSVLIKEVPDGVISRQLVQLRVGEAVTLSGPYGYFLLKTPLMSGAPLLWLATGTGISPFHSFVRTFPGLDYRLLHGCRTLAERALSRDFDPAKTTLCLTGEDGGDFRGRVTARLPQIPLDPTTQVFLCGNCDMIYDAFDLLQARGIPAGQIFTEVYY